MRSKKNYEYPNRIEGSTRRDKVTNRAVEVSDFPRAQCCLGSAIFSVGKVRETCVRRATVYLVYIVSGKKQSARLIGDASLTIPVDDRA